jgi:hypothetical protein
MSRHIKSSIPIIGSPSIPSVEVIHAALHQIKKANKPNQELVEILSASPVVEEYIHLCLAFPVRQLIWGAIALGWDLKQRCEDQKVIGEIN